MPAALLPAEDCMSERGLVLGGDGIERNREADLAERYKTSTDVTDEEADLAEVCISGESVRSTG